MKLNYLLLVAAIMTQGSKALAVTPPQVSSEYSALTENQATPTTKFNALVIESITSDNAWDNQLSIKLTSNLETTKTYKLTVVCKASKQCDLVFITKGKDSSNKETDESLSYTKVNTDWETYTLDITPNVKDTGTTISDDLTFEVGGLKDGTFEIKSISLVETGNDTNMISNGDFATTANSWYKKYGYHQFTFEVQQQTGIDLKTYTDTPVNYDYTASTTPVIGGWGTGFKAEITDEALVWSHSVITNPTYWSVQAALNQVFAKGGTYKITMAVKGEEAGKITAEMQNAIEYKSCGSFEIPLTTDFVENTFNVKCTDNGASRLIFNLGTYEKNVYVKSLKIEASYPQEYISLGETSFATHYAYYPINYSDAGLTAYAVKLNAEKSGVTFTAIDGIVPAMTAVLVKGTPGMDYVLAKSDGETATQIDTDLKISTGYAATTDKRKVYGLTTKDGVDGFYAAKEGVTIPAKLGYLEVQVNNATSMSTMASMFPIDMNNTLTGLSQVQAADTIPANATMYNLAGQKVGSAYKGIVVVNGKKMILK